MYYIAYEQNKFIVTFKDEEFTEAVQLLRECNIYFDRTIGKQSFSDKNSMDCFSLLEYNHIEYTITENAKQRFKDIVSSFKTEQEYYRRITLDESILQPDVKLFEYQKVGIDFLLSRKRGYCADDVGLGKSLQALFTFSQLYREGKVDKIFIIVRPGIAYNWLSEILTMVNVFKEEDILIVDNKNKKLLFDKHPDKKIYILPNHLLKPVFLSYKKNTDLNKSAKNIKWKSFVNLHEKLKTKKICLIIDEAHELTNSKAISTNAMLAHIEYFDYRYCLSATPTGNRFEKYYNAMALLDHGALKMTEIAFKIYISNSMGNKFDPFAVISYNIDNVKKIKDSVIDLYFIKRLKKDLPEMKYKQIIKPIYFQLSEGHRNLYRNFIQEEINKIELEKDGEITIKNILQKFPYLIQVIENPSLLKGRIGNEFIETLLNKWNIEKDERFVILKSLITQYVEDNKEKIIVYDNHPFTLNLLAKYFEKHSPLLLHGQMGYSEIDKKVIQDLYNDRNNKHRILFANPSVGGVGISFNKGGKRIIYYCAPNDAVLFEQSLGRTHRINNTEDAVAEILVADNSLDVLRYQRNTGRLKLNQDFLTKKLNRQELRELLEMANIQRN